MAHDKDDEVILRQQIETENRCLRIPFSVNIKNLDSAQVNWLMDTMESALDGKYFRTKELLSDVLADQIAETRMPLAWLNGPFLAMKIIKGDVRRITSEQEVPGGCTVYAFDQIVDFVNELQAERLAERAKASGYEISTPAQGKTNL